MTILILLGILFIGVPSSSNISKIAFVSEEYPSVLYIADPDPGSVPVPLTENVTSPYRNNNLLDCRTPDWSPDGKQIVFIHEHWLNPRDIWMINSNGTNPRALLEQEEHEGGGVYYFPTWLPDGSRIAFLGPGSSIYTMLPDGTQIENTGIRGYFVGVFNWILGGQILVGTAVWNVETQTGREILDIGEGYHSRHAEVSRDGNHIAFTKLKDERAERWETAQVWIAEMDGSNLRYLTDGFDPTWSPDSRRIVFNRGKGEPFYTDEIEKLFIINADGTELQALYDFPGKHPSWSPWLDTETAVTPATWGQVKRGH